MEEIGMFEAKTKFSEIAKRVRTTGRSIRVTNRGEPIVDIAPAKPDDGRRRPRREVIADLTQLRKTLPKSGLKQIRLDIAEGRA